MHSAIQGPAGVCRILAGKSPTFSDIFRTPCFTVFDVQDLRNNLRQVWHFAENFLQISALRTPFGGVERGWVLEPRVVQQGSVSGVVLEQDCPKRFHG